MYALCVFLQLSKKWNACSAVTGGYKAGNAVPSPGSDLATVEWHLNSTSTWHARVQRAAKELLKVNHELLKVNHGFFKANHHALAAPK